VTNEIDVAHRLEAHHADELVVELISPQDNSGSNLAIELGGGHVGLMPPVRRDHTPIGQCRGVNDREHVLAIAVMAEANVAHEPCLCSAVPLPYTARAPGASASGGRFAGARETSAGVSACLAPPDP